jgi:alkanesulfonate monooxygenase SsuD/methylene tetrahydromethanopterin reductase-like flavin-dependent oxidoreductase (luciferase family)
MMEPINFGVHLPVMRFVEEEPISRKQIISFARRAEELGYDSLSVNDHIVFRTGWLDAISSLSAIAATTSRIKIGTSVLNIVVRNPVICVKALSSIDILSSGRLFAGLGPGSSRGDYDACGIPFQDRWKRFSEALEVVNALWGEKSESESQSVDYEGSYYRLKGISIDPKPFRKPHPPIMIASWGSDQGLRRVAKYGDGWMASPYNITPKKFREKWTLLMSYIREMNKDVESFENSVMTMFGYIDDSREKVHKLIKDVLAPSLGRSVDELENLLLFGSSEECLRKISLLYESGVKRIHFWPINDYLRQIEIFFKEIVHNFR